ncbi:hypothetical protein J6Y73_00760 [bacterium]|nr:hypothetical protein [bacterium]
MNEKRKALKLVAIISSTVFMLLFLIFLFTYDLTPKSKYEITESKEEITNELRDYLNEALLKASILNILKINIDSEYVDKAFYLLVKDDNDDVIYRTNNYIIKGFNFSIKNNHIDLNLYITYKNLIKYESKVRIRLEFSESESSYSFALKSIKIGGIIIPPLVVESFLNNREQASLGNAITGLLVNIPIGTYDKDSLTFTILKSELIDEIKKGAISEEFFKGNKALSSSAATFLSILYPNKLLDLELEGDITLLLNYSKLVNVDRNIDRISYTDPLDLRYDIIFKEFLGYDSFELSKKDTRKIIMSEPFKVDPLDYNGFIKFENVDYSFNGDTLTLSIFYNVFNNTSINDYIFIKDKDRYKLDRIYIGRDDNEKQTDYLTVESTENKQNFLNLLNDLNITSNLISLSLTEDSILAPLMLKNIDVMREENTFTISYNSNQDIINTIKEAILSDDFNSTLSTDLKQKLNLESIDYLYESIENLSIENKISYFNFIKMYFKDDTLVYNYINENY